jgi:hypothetical protein
MGMESRPPLDVRSWVRSENRPAGGRGRYLAAILAIALGVIAVAASLVLDPFGGTNPGARRAAGRPPGSATATTATPPPAGESNPVPTTSVSSAPPSTGVPALPGSAAPAGGTAPSATGTDGHGLHAEPIPGYESGPDTPVPPGSIIGASGSSGATATGGSSAASQVLTVEVPCVVPDVQHCTGALTRIPPAPLPIRQLPGMVALVGAALTLGTPSLRRRVLDRARLFPRR